MRIKKLKAAGKAIIYISHRMDEIFAICDDVTVMKDGRHVVTRSHGSESRLTGLLLKDFEQEFGVPTC